MPSPAIGLSKEIFNIDQEEPFRVYGENLDDTTVELVAYLESTSFTWSPSRIVVPNDPPGPGLPADRQPSYVVLRSTPTPKVGPPVAVDDDLKVKFVFDEGGPDHLERRRTYSVRYEP